VRAVVREARQRGMSALILVEPIDARFLEGDGAAGDAAAG